MDLEYPEELHEMHNAYPLAPETTQVPDEWYSPYQKGIASELGLSKDRTEKLLLTLREKKNYVLHYQNLQLYLRLGMRLKKVHNVLAFDQKDWMEPYTRLNTELKKKATSDFEKNFLKLMNRTIVKLVRRNEIAKIRKLIFHPLYARSAVFGESLAGIQMHKDHILMNRPVYTGMSVLELSKTLMYEFYYNYLPLKYGPNCQLLYTDTDSLLLEIKTEDVCLQRHETRPLSLRHE